MNKNVEKLHLTLNESKSMHETATKPHRKTDSTSDKIWPKNHNQASDNYEMKLTLLEINLFN